MMKKYSYIVHQNESLYVIQTIEKYTFDDVMK